jgi:hypothetical protein
MNGRSPLAVLGRITVLLVAVGLILANVHPGPARSSSKYGIGTVGGGGGLGPVSSGGGGGGTSDGVSITGNGSSGSPFAAITTYLQRRISTACGGGTPVMQGVAADGTPTCVASGSGTVSSVSVVSGGSVATATTTPAITIDPTYWQRVLTGGGVAHKAVTDIATSGAATVNYFVDACAAGTGTTCTVTNNSIATNLDISPSNGASAAGVGAAKFVQAISAAGTGTLSAISEAPDLQERFYEPFMNCGVNGIFTYGTANSGTTTSPTPIAGKPGLCGLSTGTASAAGRESATSATTGIVFGSGSGVIVFRASVAVEALSTAAQGYSLRIGFLNSASAEPSAGIFFLYDRENVSSAPATGAGNTGNKDNWICVSSDASTRTEYVMDGAVTSDASFTTANKTVAAATYYDLEIVYDSTLGTPEADFYVNGTLSCKITTHIPSGTSSTHTTGVGAVILKNVGTGTAGIADIDYAIFRDTGLSR